MAEMTTASTVEGSGAAGLASEFAAVSSIAGGSKTTAAGFYGSSTRSKRNLKEALIVLICPTVLELFVRPIFHQVFGQGYGQV